jgi:hypothetical protein
VSIHRAVDPATGELVKEYPMDSDAAVVAAVTEAHGTFQNWSRIAPVAERAALIRRVAELRTQPSRTPGPGIRPASRTSRRLPGWRRLRKDIRGTEAWAGWLSHLSLPTIQSSPPSSGLSGRPEGRP